MQWIPRKVDQILLLSQFRLSHACRTSLLNINNAHSVYLHAERNPSLYRTTNNRNYNNSRVIQANPAPHKPYSKSTNRAFAQYLSLISGTIPSAATHSTASSRRQSLVNGHSQTNLFRVQQSTIDNLQYTGLQHAHMIQQTIKEQQSIRPTQPHRAYYP
jgi:hypothetical protein